MVKPAREQIAQLLDGAEASGSFSAQFSAPAAGITLSVEGVGTVKLPVGAAEERKLVAVARPAMFGRGEETLTDTSVRDTWELTADQVTLGGEWDRVLAEALADVAEGLGLPRGAKVRAELHALLVYGPDQFFAPHQDSEKDDQMVGTLVVSLPSVHTGGELIVSHGGQSKTYRPVSRDKVGFTAFYADCLHEVRPVRTGRRVTVTFNLLVEREPDGAAQDPDEELAQLLREHFSTPVPRRWSGDIDPPPNRLVVLLDHQYSERGLSAGLLKGRDVEWVVRMRLAADRAGCVTALALAEIQQTLSAFDSGDPYWGGGYDEEEEEYDDSESDYEVGELIEDEIFLGWWQIANADAGEQISLGVSESEVCAVTPTANTTPYRSEYEGYMGNYGNTVDRWYRRAAVVIWPQEKDFVARAEADSDGALVAVRDRLVGGSDLQAVRADVRELVALHTFGAAGDIALRLRIARDLEDAQLAHDLLVPVGGDNLTVECAAPLAALAAQYGDAWVDELIDTWFTVGGYFVGRTEWATSTLVPFAEALRDNEAGPVATHLGERLWAGLLPSIKVALTRGPRTRARSLAGDVPAAAALLRAADHGGVGAAVDALAALDDGILDLEVPLVRELGADAPAGLVSDAVRRLVALTATPARERDDWSISWSGDGCEICARLQTFLADRDAVEFDWPLKTDLRRHVHDRIESAELPVSHHTIRKGRPYTLHLVKKAELHSAEAARRKQWAADLAWLQELHDFES